MIVEARDAVDVTKKLLLMNGLGSVPLDDETKEIRRQVELMLTQMVDVMNSFDSSFDLELCIAR